MLTIVKKNCENFYVPNIININITNKLKSTSKLSSKNKYKVNS